MSQKDYEKAARIAQAVRESCLEEEESQADAVVEAFVMLFSDNPRFDTARFRRACIPGANVRARGPVFTRNVRARS